MDIFLKILVAIAIVAIPVLTGFLCDWIHKLAEESVKNMENERVKLVVSEIDESVRAAVSYVNQTFVDVLKKQNVWDEESAKKAFQTAFETVVETLSADATEYILDTFGDIHKYLEVKIEEKVHSAKNWY